MMQMQNVRAFMTLVSHIDRLLKDRPGRLEFRFRNDEKFERLCDETWRLHGEISDEAAQGKVVSGTSSDVLQAIERFESRYLRRIELARSKRSEQLWLELLTAVRTEEPADVDAVSEDREPYFQEFNEAYHRPVAVLNDLINTCWNLSSFDEEVAHAHQQLLLAEGAVRYIEKRLGLDIDTASDKFRRLEIFHIDTRLSGGGTDWRQVDRYLQQAITAYLLGLDLCTIALCRPLAAHIIRAVYAPTLLPDLDLMKESESALLRKVQEVREASWLKEDHAERLIDSASKVLHYKHFDDLGTENSAAVLARELLLFIRNLLHRVPG